MNCDNYKGVYSFHSGGCNIAFGDGSVQFIKDDVAADTFVSFITRGAADTTAISRVEDSEPRGVAIGAPLWLQKSILKLTRWDGICVALRGFFSIAALSKSSSDLGDTTADFRR